MRVSVEAFFKQMLQTTGWMSDGSFRRMFYHMCARTATLRRRPERLEHTLSDHPAYGAFARTALAQDFETWVLTRGHRPVPDGAHSLVADRRDPNAFVRAIQEAETDWDLVVDCIGYQPEDVVQDISAFRKRTRHLAFVSTDFIFDPTNRRLPQTEESEHYATSGYGGNTSDSGDGGGGDPATLFWPQDQGQGEAAQRTS